MIRNATTDDVAAIEEIAGERRADYEKAQPHFWQRAGDATQVHAAWLARLIEDPDVVSLVAVSEAQRITGYLFASLVSAPPVYEQSGATALVDDFAVRDPELWASEGAALLAAAKVRLAAHGASQVVVVTGHHDSPKRAALSASGLALASEWYVAQL